MNVNQLELFVPEVKEESYEGDTKFCHSCKKEFPDNFDFFPTSGMYNSEGKPRTKHLCKVCHNKNALDVRALKRTAPPIPDCCELCGCSFKNIKSLNIHLDHCKVTNTFRGWLCKTCNVGLGMLGDDLEGVHRALVYLNKHKDKIDG